MNKRLLHSVLAGVALAMPLAASANLILNGGFELPLVPNAPPHFAYRTGNDIDSWTISSTHRGVAQFDSTYRPVGADSFSVQLESGVGQSGNPTPDSIAQTISTVPGGTYLVSFLLSGYDAGPSFMRVTIDGFTQDYTTISQIYAGYAFNFVADDSSATLKFENVGPYAVSYPQIDDVSILAVPEPTTMIGGALLLLPLGASAVRKLRKNPVA